MHFMQKLRICIALLLTAALLAFSTCAYAAPTPTPVPTLPPFEETVPAYDENNPGALRIDQLYSEAAILIDQYSGEVLLEKNADRRMNPASTTKIMTALLALEYGDLNSVVIIPDEAANIPKDSSVVPVTPGEEMTFQDLLYGFMLKSGNDAGNAIAVIIAGSVDAFVDMMNDRAAELGCTNTHFVNPHGYTAENHYTTARDIAAITQEAMKHETFRNIVSSSIYKMDASSLRAEVYIGNSNYMLSSSSEYYYEYATGVKTGTTSAAGQCLVGSATKNGINLISVAFKSTVSFPHAKWQDTERMMEYGFAQYHTYSFQQLYSMASIVVPISGAAEDDPSGGMVKLNALLNRAGNYETTVYHKDLDRLLSDFRSRLTAQYTRELVAPIEEGALMGNLTFTADDGTTLTALLVADRSVAAAKKQSSPFSLTGWINRTIPVWLQIIIAVFALFFAVLCIGRSIITAREKRRRRIARERARARKAAQARRMAQARRQGQYPQYPPRAPQRPSQPPRRPMK